MNTITCLVLLIALLALAVPSLGADPAPPRMVWASTMHCFILGAMPPSYPLRTGVEDFANWPGDEGAEVERYFGGDSGGGKRVGYRLWWSARLAPLQRGGLAAVRMDLDMAQAAGLDALGVLINQSHLPDSQFVPTYRLLAQAASTHRVKIIPDLWLTTSDTKEGLARFGRELKALMDECPDGWLKYQGKPVISVQPFEYGRKVNTARKTGFIEWEAGQALYDAWGGPQAVYKLLSATYSPDITDLEGGWGAQGADTLSKWTASAGWNDPEQLDLVAAARKYGKPLCWPINCTYYGTGPNRPGYADAAEDLGITRMSEQWRRAISLGAAWATVQTWNDFSEDHAITETNYRGRTQIELTRYYADWYRTGRAPAIAREKIYLFHHRQLLHATLPPGTIRAHNDQYHPCPNTDYLQVVTLLNKPARVRLRVGEAVWETAAPAGWHEWLVCVPSERKEMGPLREAWNHGAESYPASTDWRTVTVATTIPAGRPRAAVVREGAVVGSVVSRTDLAGEGQWQDLCMVGTEGEVGGSEARELRSSGAPLVGG